MDKSKELVLWVAGFAGVFLLYAAYKGKFPLALLQEYASGSSANTVAAAGSGVAGAAATNSPTATSVVGAAVGSSTGYASSDGFVYDRDGLIMGQVPPAYAHNPASYIPPR